MVVVTLRWPGSSWIVRMSWPSSSRWVAQGVAGGALVELCTLDRGAQRALDHSLVQVVAAELTGIPVAVERRGGEDPLPGGAAGRAGVLAGQGEGELDLTGAALEVGAVLLHACVQGAGQG